MIISEVMRSLITDKVDIITFYSGASNTAFINPAFAWYKKRILFSVENPSVEINYGNVYWLLSNQYDRLVFRLALP